MKIGYDINTHRFSYDLEHLIRAFFPEAEVKKEYSQDMFVNAHIRDKTFSIELIKDNNIIKKEAEFTNVYEEDKKLFGRILYDILFEYSKKHLPWGILTGIRPTKIVSQLIEKGYDNIEDILVEQYYISRAKSRFLKEVAINENNIIEKLLYDHVALYIGIPICPSRCIYCSFSCVTTNSIELIDKYTQALIIELQEKFKAIRKNGQEVKVIYIGGGTPSILGIKNIRLLFEVLKSNIDMNNLLEITFEVGRPETLSDELTYELKKYSTRICINPQSSNDVTLLKIGRKHTFLDVIKAFEKCNKIGVNNINSDLIIGLPDETIEDFKKSLEDVLQLLPSSITVHTLSLKRASDLKFKMGEYNFISADDVDYCLNYTYDRLKEEGYKPYYMYRQKNMLGNFENVGYAKDGYECLYNCMIMHEKHNIYAVGAKAVSKFVYQDGKIDRVFNVADVKLYIDKVIKGDAGVI